MERERAPSIVILIVYFLLFYSIWTIWGLVIRPELEQILGAWQLAGVGGAVKLAVWTLPALLLTAYYRTGMRFSLEEILRTPVNWRFCGWIMGVFLVYHLAASLLAFRRIGIHEEFEPVTLVGTVLLVGVTEEVVFRGWLLNALALRMPIRSAVILNALLFLMVHFPGWYHQGLLGDPYIVTSSCIAIVLLSVVFSLAFLKSRSIWVPIVLHMSWNLFNILLFG